MNLKTLLTHPAVPVATFLAGLIGLAAAVTIPALQNDKGFHLMVWGAVMFPLIEFMVSHDALEAVPAVAKPRRD